MKRRALIIALAIGGSCVAGPVEDLARHRPEINEPEPTLARPLDEWDRPSVFFVAPSLPASRYIAAVVASLEQRATGAESLVGFAESVLGFTGLDNRREAHRRFGGLLQYYQLADEAIQVRAAALNEELDADVVLQFEQDAVHTREVVIPLLAARAAVALAAVASPSVEQESLAKLAREIARGIEPVSTWAEAQRGAVIAGASFLLGDDRGAIAAAEAAFRASEESGEPGGVVARLAFEAGTIAAASAARTDPAASQAWLRRLDAMSKDLSLNFADRIALSDAQFLALKRASDSAPSRQDRTRLLGEAFRAFEPAVSWLVTEPVHTSVWDHVANAAKSAQYPYAELPLIAAVGRAKCLMEPFRSGWRAGAPDERDRARRAKEVFELLKSVIAESDVRGTPHPVMTAAYFEWSYAAWDAGGELALQAPAILIRAAEQFGAQGSAYNAQRVALFRVSELIRQRPGDTQAEDACIDALRRLNAVRTEMEVSDRARRLLARLLANRAANSGDEEAAREAVSVAVEIEDIGEAPAAWTDVCWALSQLLQSARSNGDPAEARRHAEQLLEALAAADRAMGELTPTLGVYRANAALALGLDANATEIVDRFEPVWAEDGSVLPDAMEAALRTRVAAGDSAGAHRAAVALRRADTVRATRVIGELADQAWAEMLPLTRRLDAFGATRERAESSHLVAIRLAESVVEKPRQPLDEAPKATEALIRLGWALLLAGDAGAARSKFDEWVNPDGHRKVVPRPAPLQLRMGRAEAMFAMGDDQPAFALYREIADNAAFADPGGRDFWRAWTRMLEILARQNTDGARTETITREIARLRAMPSAPDHPDCLARLAEIEQALNRASTR